MLRVDSRKVEKGDTFIALKGISSDGHDYISKAIENGASKIIAEKGNYSVETILVKDTREYLTNYLSQKYNKELNEMTLIGITGANGKTTSAYLIYQALNNLNIKCAYIGTIGFYLDKKIHDLPNTTPDILELYEMFMECYNKGYKHIVLEVSSQAISYKRVDKILFDYALFTNLTQDHLDYHKTMENYALAKQQLFKQLKKNGKAIINADDKNNHYFVLNNDNTFYGINSGDVKVKSYVINNNYTYIKYEYLNNEYEVTTNLVGKYNIYNILLTITLLIKMNISIAEINRIIPKLVSPVGRMDKIVYKNNLIVVDYAHTLDAMENIVSTVSEIKHNNIYIVFGCTGDRDRTKRSMMTNYALKNSKKVIITNDDPHTEDVNQIVSDMLKNNTLTNYEICLDRSLAIKKGIDLLKENDILLILGKGHEEFMIVGKNKIPFNDMKEVKKYINNSYVNN